jgi:hypothetical protein
MIISYNFAHYHPDIGGGVFGHSQIFTCKTFRQFSDELRYSIAIKNIFEFAEKRHVPRSYMCLLVNIDNNHYFRIRMINVREYKQAVDDYIKSKEQ